MQDGQSNHWHLDKRVPIALIVALALQGAGGVWWASTANERLSQVERRLEGFADRSEMLQSEVNQQGVSLAIVATRLDDTNRNIDLLRSEISTTNRLLREILSGPTGAER